MRYSVVTGSASGIGGAVAERLVLVADLTRSRHRWAVHDERHLMSAGVGAGLIEAEGCVAGVHPAALVVRKRLRTTEEVEPLKVLAPDVGVVNERGEELRGPVGLALPSPPEQVGHDRAASPSRLAAPTAVGGDRYGRPATFRTAR